MIQRADVLTRSSMGPPRVAWYTPKVQRRGALARLLARSVLVNAITDLLEHGVAFVKVQQLASQIDLRTTRLGPRYRESTPPSLRLTPERSHRGSRLRTPYLTDPSVLHAVWKYAGTRQASAEPSWSRFAMNYLVTVP